MTDWGMILLGGMLGGLLAQGWQCTKLLIEIRDLLKTRGGRLDS